MTRDDEVTQECAADEDARADRRLAGWQRRQREAAMRRHPSYVCND